MKIHFVETESAEEEFFREALAAAGAHEPLFASSLEAVPEDAEVLCTSLSSQVDAAFLETHPRLRFVATRSSSVDHFDVAALHARGIRVANVPGYSDPSVAEHTFALLLALTRRLRELMPMPASARHFSYEATRCAELAGKVLGIVGTGHVGRRVAKIARAFEMEVVATDVTPDAAFAESSGLTYVPFEELLARADAITLHAPLRPETYHLLNRETFARCRPGVLIINTARGALVQTEALREALDSGQVGGAGLDVLQDERVLRDTVSHIVAADIVRHLRSDALASEARDAERVRELQELMLGEAVLARSNVVFTPHVAFNSVEAVFRRNRMTIETLLAFVEGRPINLISLDGETSPHP